MDDLSEFLGVFLEEAREQLDILERDLIRLEEDQSLETLQGIFRAAHTLKGSSRAMSFVQMGELTHAMEDMLDAMLHHGLAATQPVTDALLKGLDSLKDLVDEIADQGQPSSDVSAQTKMVREVLAAASGTSPSDEVASNSASPTEQALDWIAVYKAAPPESQEACTAALEAGAALLGVRAQIAQDCMLKSVRASMLLQRLENVGSVLAAHPSEEEMDADEFDGAIQLILAVESKDVDVAAECLQVSEVVLADVEPVALGGDGAKQDDFNLDDAQTTVEAVEPAIQADASSASSPDKPDPSSPQASAPKPPAQSQTVRVDVARLDTLLNLVGELVIDQTCIAELASQLESEFGICPAITRLKQATGHFARVAGEMQEQIMRARMLPIESMLNRFPRMVRDISQNLGKEVDLNITGKETELDRSVLEVIADPLIHILRNSVDHGIEMPEVREAQGKPRRGTVNLRASHEESHIVLQIEDDGKGIDPDGLRKAAVGKGIITAEAASRLSDREAINLIFAPGFSTAAQVSEISGRGVGMDIVRNNLMKLGATIEIDSIVGKGSRFTIKLPLTLAIIRGLLVRVDGGIFALPLGSITETLEIEPESVRSLNHRRVVVHRDMTLPVVSLSAILNGGIALPRLGDPLAEQPAPVVVAHSGDRTIGLVVDELVGEQEIVIKSLGPFVGDVPGISGATLLGSGQIALIVDANTVVEMANGERVEAYAA